MNLEREKCQNYISKFGIDIMSLKHVHILVGGRVQGVGFRYFTWHRAEELHITGYVQNTPDGRVEIEASGDSRELDAFIDWMRIGPAHAIINSFIVKEITPPTLFKGFSIQRW